MNSSLLLIFITIALSPLYIIRFHFNLPFLNFFYPTTLLEILIGLTLLSTTYDFFKEGRQFKKLKTPLDLYILIFIVSAFLAIFTSIDPSGGVGIFRAYFLEPVLFFYCLIYQFKNTNNFFVPIAGLITAAVWLSVLSVFQKFFNLFIFANHEMLQGRVSGVYNSANALVLFIAPAALICFSLFLARKKMVEKVFLLLLCVLFYFVIDWTKSRGGMYALLFSVVVLLYSVLIWRNKVVKKFWYVPLGVVGVLLIIFGTIFYQHTNFIPNEGDVPYTKGDTLQIRYFIWAGTANLLKEHPVFGAGLNGFKNLYSTQYVLKQYQEPFQYPHNIILTFWAETGLLGLFAFLLLIGKVFTLTAKALHQSINPILGCALFSVLSYWIIHGLVDVPYFKNDLSLEFWVIMGICVLWSRQLKKNS